MKRWESVEAHADDGGVIPEAVYEENVCHFNICPDRPPEVVNQEAAVWQTYLSAKRKSENQKNMYAEMYRYEWYEGRYRTGFWGNIEHAVQNLSLGEMPKIAIFSAGSGRDLLKVGLAAGIWQSMAPEKIRNTYKEISADYFQLTKPDAQVVLTEYEENNLAALKQTVAHLIEKGLLRKNRVTIRKWDFRKPSPVAAGTQDLVIFSLTGNYAAMEEQPLILNEIARCVKIGGYFIASTMSSAFNFRNVISFRNKLRLFFATPLAWPIAIEFYRWQSRWGRVAARMNEAGHWKNMPARQWAEFIAPLGMQKEKIYPGPSKIVPVEVLVAKKVRKDRNGASRCNP